jgi:hypothetical protein
MPLGIKMGRNEKMAINLVMALMFQLTAFLKSTTSRAPDQHGRNSIFNNVDYVVAFTVP